MREALEKSWMRVWVDEEAREQDVLLGANRIVWLVFSGTMLFIDI